MSPALNPQSRFDTLVVGAANRLAVTAARAVAEAPGSVYNPLCIYARPGLGKTHLLMAIGHAAQAIDPNLGVEYLTLDEFVESFERAVAAGNSEQYRKRFAAVGVLLVDDVQFLAGRHELQAELLRIVDTIQAAGRQIVLSSDRPPADIESLDERLLRRFGGGLVVDVGAPDYETRAAILRRKAEERRATFMPEVLDAVAALPIDNVRELLGALNRLIAYQAVSEQPLDPDRAREVVGAGERRNDETVDAADESDGMDRTDQSTPSTSSDSPAADEFGDFLSEVVATVSEQVETWRSRVAAAVLHWEGEGFATGRLGAVLQQEVPVDPDETLRQYEADIARLRELEAEAVALAPELAGATAFRDPDDLAAAEAALERAREQANPPPAPLPLWRLDDVAEGGSNRMAVRAAYAVVEEPGSRYNPLVLIGGSGSGKTHILHGIGNALVEGGRRVACAGAAEFTGELIEAIDRDAVAGWQARYRRADALLLDDVHLLAGKDRTQEELFVLFNRLFEAGRQMVFTSAVPLAELAGIEARLLTRMEGGLVVELPAPDREVRQRIVERMLNGKHDRAADGELVSYIANRPAESARAVQGMVQRVLNAAEARHTEPNAALAREALEGGRPTRRSLVRSVVAPAGGMKSREKMVWEWPDVSARIVEEWR